MSSGEFKAPSLKAPQRHTVRIVKRRLPSGTAALSLAAVATTAVFSFAAWRWWRSDETPPIPPPVLSEVELDWKCPNGHSFLAAGQAGPHPCPECSEPAFPHTEFSCAKHGAYEVLAEFATDAEGRTKPVKFKVLDGEWADAGEGPRCPRCGEVMARKNDPLAGLPRAKRKGQ